jgi:hypothetical protein
MVRTKDKGKVGINDKWKVRIHDKGMVETILIRKGVQNSKL